MPNIEKRRLSKSSTKIGTKTERYHVWVPDLTRDTFVLIEVAVVPDNTPHVIEAMAQFYRGDFEIIGIREVITDRPVPPEHASVHVLRFYFVKEEELESVSVKAIIAGLATACIKGTWEYRIQQATRAVETICKHLQANNIL